MKNRILVVFLFFCALILKAQTERSRVTTLMGSRFEITVVDKDSATAEKDIDLAIAEISRIENLISEWRPQTQISLVNRNAGISPVKVDPEVLKLTRTALYFSDITRGAFDISIVAMDKIWKFDGTMKKMPSKKEIRKSVRNVDYRNIVLDTLNSTIFLKNKGMKIGFGSIGKAYGADRAKKILQEKGVPAGLINAAGDIAAWGKPTDGESWAIGIQNPFIPDEIEKVVFLKDQSVVTSGNYEKYVEFNGQRYSHIINPKTGMPSTGLVSVSIMGPDATFANGLSTSVMVLGKETGLKLLKKFPQYFYFLITDKAEITENLPE